MTRHHLFASAAAALGLLAAAPVLAAEETDAGQPDTAFTVGELVVTANLAGGLASQSVLTSVDRLGPDVIERQNVDNTWELFGRLPGVLLTDFNQGTTSGRFSIRGFNGEGEINAVKLLIDGVPGNTNDGAVTFVDMVFPLEISAIEVVRGTNDPRYGLNAIAGSASIFTREGGTYADARASYGGWNAREAQLAVGRQGEQLFQNLFGAWRSSDGYRGHSQLERISLAGKWGYDDGTTQAVLIARHYRAEAEEPGYLTKADAASAPRRSYAASRTDGGDREMNQISVRLERRFGDHLSAAATTYANRFDDTRFVRFSASVAQQERVAREHQWGALGVVRYDATDWARLEAGADLQHQEVASRRYLTAERVRTRQTRDQTYDLDTWGGYVMATLEPTATVRIIPGYRVDKVAGDYRDELTGVRASANDYGLIGQPKLSLTWTPHADVVLYGNWGKTFQVGVGSGAYKIPPRVTDLEASINEGWELGVKLSRTERLQTRLAVWRQTATGEVKRKLNDPTGDSENLGSTEREGLDVQASLDVTSKVRLWTAATYQRAVIETPDPATPAARGKRIDHVPAHLYSGGADLKLSGRLQASLEVSAQDSYYLEQTNSTGRFGAFVLANLNLSYALTKRLELQAQVKNLTDERYEYVWWDGTQSLHSPGDPRALYASLMVRF